MLNVYLRPSRDGEDDPYWPVARGDGERTGPMDFQDMFFDHWRRNGLSDEEIEKRYARWSEGMHG